MAEAQLCATQAVTTAADAMVSLAPPRSLASIASCLSNLDRVQEKLGIILPATGRQLAQGGITYLWSGLQNWLALAETDDPAFSANLADQLRGIAAVTDQSDGRAIFRVQGVFARDALAKLLPIDLYPGVFGQDSTAMTLAGHIGIQIWRTGENSFELACFRSYAEALYEALRDACRAWVAGVK